MNSEIILLLLDIILTHHYNIFRLRNNMMDLANEYPEQFGPILSQWSSIDKINHRNIEESF